MCAENSKTGLDLLPVNINTAVSYELNRLLKRIDFIRYTYKLIK